MVYKPKLLFDSLQLNTYWSPRPRVSNKQRFTMKLANTIAFFVILLTSVSAFTATYDTVYDDAKQSLSAVLCSDGPNGLLTRNFTTFGSLPKYPYVGGAPAVTSWNSPGCGTCWAITYTNANGIAKTINLLAIDGSANYNMPTAAMNDLTDGQALFLGRVSVTDVNVHPSVCGL